MNSYEIRLLWVMRCFQACALAPEELQDREGKRALDYAGRPVHTITSILKNSALGFDLWKRLHCSDMRSSFVRHDMCPRYGSLRDHALYGVPNRWPPHPCVGSSLWTGFLHLWGQGKAVVTVAGGGREWSMSLQNDGRTRTRIALGVPISSQTF